MWPGNDKCYNISNIFSFHVTLANISYCLHNITVESQKYREIWKNALSNIRCPKFCAWPLNCLICRLSLKHSFFSFLDIKFPTKTIHIQLCCVWLVILLLKVYLLHAQYRQFTGFRFLLAPDSFFVVCFWASVCWRVSYHLPRLLITSIVNYR